MAAPDGSIPRSAPAGAGDRSWPYFCAVLAIVSGAVGSTGRSAAWAWHPVEWPQQAWLLWSAALAPASSLHWGVSVVALLVLAVLGMSLGAGRPAVGAVLLAWPLGTAALALWPEVSAHAGLSGLACTMWAVLGVQAARTPATRPSGVALLAMLGFKLLTDEAWIRPIGYDPDWGMNVLYAAHLGGAVAGAACALLVGRRRQGPTGPQAGPHRP
jgi:membrane associated rhomboid family serine protease